MTSRCPPSAFSPTFLQPPTNLREGGSCPALTGERTGCRENVAREGQGAGPQSCEEEACADRTAALTGAWGDEQLTATWKRKPKSWDPGPR